MKKSIALVVLLAFSNCMQAMESVFAPRKKIAKPRSKPQLYRIEEAQKYIFGTHGNSVDYQKAYEILIHILEKKTAFSNRAKQELGYLYYVGGPGIEKDHAKALFYFKEVAEKIDESCLAQSLLKIGLIYYVGGPGVEQNLLLAREWFNEAADQKFHTGIQEQARRFLDDCEAKINRAIQPLTDH